jgi:endonuclease/exonuclease/phosphatase family metal-dependent hydrolase
MTTGNPLRVMTFNVRQMDGDDGAQSWEHRKDVLADSILLYRPDLLGAQEIFSGQTEFLLERIADFDCFGRGRFGDDRDKHNKIFFDRRRFTLKECGEFWFSRTPQVAGSSDWQIPRPRMVTWGKLREASGAEILILNTHLPYGRSADEARRESALLILRQIAALPPELPLFLTGDFNASPEGEIYALLTGVLEDAWTTARQTIGPDSTLHGFGKVSGRRLDWILHRGAGRPLTVETVTHTSRGLYPSDHYPVVATFLLDCALPR